MPEREVTEEGDMQKNPPHQNVNKKKKKKEERFRDVLFLSILAMIQSSWKHA